MPDWARFQELPASAAERVSMVLATKSGHPVWIGKTAQENRLPSAGEVLTVPSGSHRMIEENSWSASIARR
jgi:hypothetical protein